MDARVLESKNKYEGKVFKSNNCGDIIVLEYINTNNIKVQFVETGYSRIVSVGNLLSGRVRDPSFPSVYNIGWLGKKFSKDEFTLQSYVCWNSLLFRCYHFQSKSKRPTYEDCTVSEDFKCYATFKDWCEKQIGFNSMDEKGKTFALDKDILIKGNKVYSSETCCFVPQEINSLFNTHKNSRDGAILGVRKERGSFRAVLSRYSVRRSVGLFDTEQEAFYAYKQAKEDYIKEVANKWKDQIDPRAYEALMSWVVEGSD